jgi:hypothetical protein
MAKWGPTLVFGVGVLCRLGVGGVLGSWWGYDRLPGDPLRPDLALFMMPTWLFVFVVLLGYIALAHRPALRAVIRRPAWSVLPLLLAAAWPLSLAHGAEAGCGVNTRRGRCSCTLL